MDKLQTQRKYRSFYQNRYLGTDTKTRQRYYVQSYSKFDQNYTGNVLTNLADAVIADTVFEVESASGITAKTYIDIDNEQLFVKSSM